MTRVLCTKCWNFTDCEVCSSVPFYSSGYTNTYFCKSCETEFSQFSLTQDTSNATRSICPVCDGDGGVRQGCYKCDGTGWYSSYNQSKKVFSPANKKESDNSRISNANYNPMTLGAVYREHDGRFGSSPEHDDYSEESGSD